MSKLGEGIAIAGIWISAGIMSFSPVAAGQLGTIAGSAAVATFFVALFL